MEKNVVCSLKMLNGERKEVGSNLQGKNKMAMSLFIFSRCWKTREYL